MTPQECAGRTLAFLGDAVWSLFVRNDLIENGQGRGSQLQKKSIAYVSAKAQAKFYTVLHEEQFFTEAEEEVYRRGRNGNAGTVPNNTDTGTYRMSTGFEAILGMLYMEHNEERIREIFQKAKEIL